MDEIFAQYRVGTQGFSRDVATIVGGYNTVEKKSEEATGKMAGGLRKVDTQAKKTAKDVAGVGASMTKAGKESTAAGSKISKGLGGIQGQLKKIGLAVGAYLGARALYNFGKASAQAFLEAEQNAQVLLNVLDGNVSVQQRLLEQAKELQNTTIFDDDTIINAQTFLATQGRTEEQIRKTISAAVQLASVQKIDLQTATQQLDATYEGNIGRLGKLDERFTKLTKTQLANGGAIDLVNEKYQGFAEGVAQTDLGRIEQLKNRFGEMQESIGGLVVQLVGNLQPAISKTIDFLTRMADEIEEGFQSKAEDFAEQQQQNLRITTETLQEFIDRDIQKGLTTSEAFAHQFALIRREFEYLQALGPLALGGDIESVRQNAEALLSLLQQNTDVTANTRKEISNFIIENQKLYKVNSDAAKLYETKVTPTVTNTKTAYELLNDEVTKLNKKLLDQITLGKDTTDTVEKLNEKTKELSRINRLAKMRLLPEEDEIARQVDEFFSVTRRKLEVGAAQLEMALQGTVDDYTEQQIQKSKDLLEALGINQKDIVQQQQKQLDELFQSGLIKQQDYINAVTVLQAQSFSQAAGQISEAFGNINTALSGFFGEAAEKNVAFAVFMKSLAAFQIGIQQAQAIANSIAAITSAASSGNILGVIGGITGIIASLGTIFAGVTDAVNAAQPPAAPQFAKGTPYLKRGLNPAGIDTIPVMANEGEAIIPTHRNAEAPGLAEDWINGKLDRWIMRAAAPILMKQEKKYNDQKNKDFAERVAESLALKISMNSNDYRTHRDLLALADISGNGFKNLTDAVKKTTKKRGGNA